MQKIGKEFGKNGQVPAPGLSYSHEKVSITSPSVVNALLSFEESEHKAEKPENTEPQTEFAHLFTHEIEKCSASY